MSTVNIKIGDKTFRNIDTLYERNADNENSFKAFVYEPEEEIIVTEDDGKVIFIDYDGTVIDEWNVADVASKTSLPPKQNHEILVCQGWNWRLDEIKSYMNNHPRAYLTVGLIYDTIDTCTRVIVNLTPSTGKQVRFGSYGRGTTDWGDGTISGDPYHDYAEYGKYIIKHTGEWPSGGGSIDSLVSVHIGSSEAYEYNFQVNFSSQNTFHLSLAENTSYVGSPNSFTELILPRSMTSIPYVSREYNYSKNIINMVSLAPTTLTTNSLVTDSLNHLMVNHISFPDGFTISNNITCMLMNCTNLERLTLPSSMSTVLSSFFANNKLKEIDYPQITTMLQANYNVTLFEGCTEVRRISLPNLTTYTLYGGGNSWRLCNNNYRLEYMDLHNLETEYPFIMYVTSKTTIMKQFLLPKISVLNGTQNLIPCKDTVISSVTQSISGSGFFNNIIQKYIKFPKTLLEFAYGNLINNVNMTLDFSEYESIPTAGTNFSGCYNLEVIVPDALYNDWIEATNWCIIAQYIVKASEVQQ